MRWLLLLLLCLGPHAQAQTYEDAKASALQDIVSTGFGLALGAAELNPLGILAVPLKFAAIEHAETLPDGEKQTAHATYSSVWRGAAVNNFCLAAMILTGGTATPVCLFLGFASGAIVWQQSAMEREFWNLCAYERKANPELKCVYSKPQS